MTHIGQIVHFFDAALKQPKRPRAAIIVGYHDDDAKSLHLNVFGHPLHDGNKQPSWTEERVPLMDRPLPSLVGGKYALPITADPVDAAAPQQRVPPKRDKAQPP